MNTVQSLFINGSTIIAYLCVFSFLLLAFFAIKLTLINNKHIKDN